MNDGFVPINKPLSDGHGKKYLNECVSNAEIERSAQALREVLA
jgi:hypothetical protein